MYEFPVADVNKLIQTVVQKQHKFFTLQFYKSEV